MSSPVVTEVMAAIRKCVQAALSDERNQDRTPTFRTTLAEVEARLAASVASRAGMEPVAMTDERIAELAQEAIGYDGTGFQEVHSGDLRWFARCIERALTASVVTVDTSRKQGAQAPAEAKDAVRAEPVASTPASGVAAGFWLAPLELDGAMTLAFDRCGAGATRHWRAMRDSWLARHPAAPASAATDASEVPSQQPEFCPYCDGSGDSTARSGGGPDTWDEPCVCPRCKGAQTLRAAYDTLAEELPALQLKVAQLGIFHSHATRYGWAPNQTDGTQSFEKLAAQWLAENAAPEVPAARQESGEALQADLCEFCGGTGADGSSGGFCDLCNATGLKPYDSPTYRRAVECRDALAAAQAAPVAAEAPKVVIEPEPMFYGRWHHGNGNLCCGSMRYFRADFDTNPAPDVREGIFDWICATMNAALDRWREQKSARESIEFDESPTASTSTAAPDGEVAFVRAAASMASSDAKGQP